LRRSDEALLNKCCTGHCKATEVEDDLRTPRNAVWRKKCGQQVSGAAFVH